MTHLVTHVLDIENVGDQINENETESDRDWWRADGRPGRRAGSPLGSARNYGYAPAVARDVRPSVRRARRPVHPRPHRGGREDRAGHASSATSPRTATTTAAKDEQGHMEGRIRQLEHILGNSEIIAPPAEGVVGPGSIVTLVYDGDTDDQAERYLVGHIEGARRRPRRRQPRGAARCRPARGRRGHRRRVPGAHRRATWSTC